MKLEFDFNKVRDKLRMNFHTAPLSATVHGFEELVHQLEEQLPIHYVSCKGHIGAWKNHLKQLHGEENHVHETTPGNFTGHAIYEEQPKTCDCAERRVLEKAGYLWQACGSGEWWKMRDCRKPITHPSSGPVPVNTVCEFCNKPLP